MGSIVTFYSFKGGVGRTMALANIAILLTRAGKRVLAIDWDLEAPGLDRYYRTFDVFPKNGLIDLLIEARTAGRAAGRRSKSNARDAPPSDTPPSHAPPPKEAPPSEAPPAPNWPRWRDYVSNCYVGGTHPLQIIAAGQQNDAYAAKVLEFNWVTFFSDDQGGAFIESLRTEWVDGYDIVLVDSRTGITDSGGVCTIQLPDVLVPVFTTNDQSLNGVKDIAVRAQRARKRSPWDRPPLLVFPLPSRFDSRSQFAESQQWLQRFANELSEFYGDWLPKDITPRQAVEQTKLPYIAFFSFGEKLPVVTDTISDPESLGYAYATAASLIGEEFQNAASLAATQPRTLESQIVHQELTTKLEEKTTELERAARTSRIQFAVTALVTLLALIVGLVGFWQGLRNAPTTRVPEPSITPITVPNARAGQSGGGVATLLSAPPLTDCSSGVGTGWTYGCRFGPDVVLIFPVRDTHSTGIIVRNVGTQPVIAELRTTCKSPACNDKSHVLVVRPVHDRTDASKDGNFTVDTLAPFVTSWTLQLSH